MPEPIPVTPVKGPVKVTMPGGRVLMPGETATAPAILGGYTVTLDDDGAVSVDGAAFFPPPAVGQRWRLPEGEVSIAAIGTKAAHDGAEAYPVLVVEWSDGEASEMPPDLSICWPPDDGVLVNGA
jgi:hypothetical protein